MKGGFEPIDENLLKELDYIDIITKPFDSNALVTRLKEILDKPAAPPSAAGEEMPSSLPEDVPEIDSISEASEEINFSDVKSEIDSDKIIPDEAEDSEDELPREDVLPSEEKTQGSQFEKEDKLSFENIEEIENPFKDEKSTPEPGEDGLTEEEREIKENIREQEKELEIGSLTREEINIKQIIEKQKADTGIDPTPAETKEDTAEHVEDTLAEDSEAEVGSPPTIEIDDQRDSIAPPEAEVDVAPPPPEAVKEPLSIETPPPPEAPMEISLDTDKPSGEGDMKIEFAEEQPTPEPPKPTPPESTDAGKAIDKELITKKVEDTLTVAVQEILWEIIPPLAEKIIKEEIQSIKTKIDNSEE
jgi:hypothetical protein